MFESSYIPICESLYHPSLETNINIFHKICNILGSITPIINDPIMLRWGGTRPSKGTAISLYETLIIDKDYNELAPYFGSN